VGPAGLVISLGSEFIDNADALASAGKDAEAIKQDCELKAAARLLPRIKKAYPQLQIVVAVDNLYVCGGFFALIQELKWSLVATFKEGRTPALWREYQALLTQCPDNVVHRQWVEGAEQTFRWVNQLDYQDSEGREFTLDALECTEVSRARGRQYFAWLTLLPVTRKTVEVIAQQGGRDRWKVENEGFNRQKNSGLNLEHVYSIDPQKWKSYYLLLQIAFVLVQLLERGSLLRHLAQAWGKTVGQLFGSLKNIARRLLESLRYQPWEESWFDVQQAHGLRISFDTS